jgi:hypothetical protein
VYLLGFGFGARNIERLGLKQLPQQQGVAKATAAGLTQHELNQVVALLGGKVDLRITDCIGLFRDVAYLD